ncbi:unnamed protein product [Cuscuta epithymum]|uniref:F-box domain-containing protein n=1 Tax=Cuscuta epithymum TaxID=186058 RepID=A0AAV0EDE9_9ASTE|nr:unnamed protein product [Cuscuta epithymum]
MQPSLQSLPDELKIEILKRLPAKSLICLSAVSKPWLSILTSSEFISAHLSEGASKQFFFATTANRNSCFALIKDADKVDGDLTVQIGPIIRPDQHFGNRFSIMFHPFNVTEFEIVGSFDGLLCLTFTQNNSHRTIILWNPSIRRHVLLPPPSIHTPSKGCNAIGFCVTCDGDYRVVWVHEKNEDSAMFVEIYSLNSGKWRIRSFTHDLFPKRWLFGGQAFVGGKVHWIGREFEYEVDEIYDARDISSVTSFNIDEEILRDVPLPNVLKGFDCPARLFIAVVGESLGIIDCEEGFYDIWVMQDYGNVDSWSRLYVIHIQDCRKRLPLIVALNTWKNSGISAGAHQWFSFMDSEPFSVYGEYGDDTYEYVAKYVESLVLLGHKDAVADVHLLQAIAVTWRMAEDNVGDDG